MSTRDFRNNDFQMLSRPEYFHNLAKDLDKTKKGDRAFVATMGLAPTSPEIEEVMRAMNAAAARGVTISLLMDAFGFLVDVYTKIPGPLWYSPKLPFDR